MVTVEDFLSVLQIGLLKAKFITPSITLKGGGGGGEGEGNTQRQQLMISLDENVVDLSDNGTAVSTPRSSESGQSAYSCPQRFDGHHLELNWFSLHMRLRSRTCVCVCV